MKYYAIKMPDGSWIMHEPRQSIREAWEEASWHGGLNDVAEGFNEDWHLLAGAAGYRCVEVVGFKEAGE